LKSHEEEYERIERGDFFDIYYAGPLVSPTLYKLGYLPVAKHSGQRDCLFTVVREIPPEGEILVAVPFLKPAGIALMSLDLSRIRVVLVSNFPEVFRLLKEGKVHAGIMYNETWSQIPSEEKEGFKVLEEFVFESSHLFMVKAGLEDRVKKALLSLEGIEPASEEDVRNTERLFFEFDRFSSLWSRASIAEAVSKSEHIGVLIYQDKILYANDALLKALGYKREEVVGKDTYHMIEELIHPLYREKVRQVVELRLSGKNLKMEYGEVPYYRKDGSLAYMLTTSETILYEGRYSGVVFFVDVTKRKRLERLYRLLQEVNQIITQSNLEEELFQNMCDALTRSLVVDFLWVGTVEGSREGLRPTHFPKFKSSYYRDFISCIEKKAGNIEGIAEEACRTNAVQINENTLNMSDAEVCKGRMLDAGFFSSCVIPLQRGGRVEFLLFLYSGEPYFFQEEMAEVLYEIKNDLEFALHKFESTEQSILMSEALKNTSWVFITDSEGRILYVNDAVCQISGYTREELIGQKPNIFKSGHHPPDFYRELWESILSGEPFHGIFVNRKKDGEIFYLEESIYPIRLPNGALRFVGIGKDRTREIQLSSELERLTFYDVVTGLYNFDGFKLRARDVLKGNGKFVLFVIDLYRFSFVNKNYGIIVGEKALAEVANRLKEAFPSGILCRVSGDEFALLMGPLQNEEDVLSLMDLLKSVFDKPLFVEGYELNISFNAGVSIYPTDGKDINLLYEKAVVALGEAKEAGEGEVKFFEEHLEEKADKYAKVMSLLSKALEENLFVFYYQPYFKNPNLRLAGFEALVRIKDREGNLYNPGYFIDHLERSRFLPMFERWSLEEAKRSYEKLRVPVSLNISARSFRNQSFFESLMGLSGNFSIVIEITERLLMEDFDRAVELLKGLRETGLYRIALDDFGTGYSSLSYLSRLPVDILKIDISFTQQIVGDRKIRSIVKNLIKIASDLGIETLAEGVEKREELELLQEMGCTYVQGYFLGKPMPEEDALKLVESMLEYG
ncbi:MAG: EAL domain-containing protein, partial [Aquificaceae bacterium]|nr:EAL domain-containing protein [Aquificaceae bacterium]